MIKDKKKLVILIVLILIIVWIIIFINNRKNTKELDIKYSYDKEINYTKFTKHFDDKETIKIVNNTDKVKVYSIKWINVENTLKYQNKFLYEISCEGDNCNTISPSQMPVADFPLFIDIYLNKYQKQKYTIKFKYKGKKDTKGFFKARFVVEEGITDQEKYDKFIKEEQGKLKAADRMNKDSQEKDNK